VLTAGVSVCVALWIWALHYQPVQWDGGLDGAGHLSPPVVGVFTADQTHDNVLGSEFEITHVQPGGMVGLGLGIGNTGSHPVRVTAVHIFDQAPFPWVHESAYMSDGASGSGGPMVPFRPVTLKPHAHLDLIAAMTIDACPTGLIRPTGELGKTSFLGVRVEFEAFGVHHSTEIENPRSVLSLDGWPLCGRPRPAASTPSVSVTAPRVVQPSSRPR
jgi:hypothetical protein